jgi:signal transduction histidine kinase
MSIRARLLFTTIAVVFIPVYFLNRHAVDFFDRFTRTALEREMGQTAFAAGELYREFSDARDQEVLHGLLHRIAAHADSRIRLFNHEGALRYDSAQLDDYLAQTESGAWPELNEAYTGAYGARYTVTPDRKYVFYYIAHPVLAEEEVLAVVHVARHTQPIIRAIVRMRENQRMAIGIALAVAGLFAVVVAQTLTWRLRRLTRAAAECGQGRPFPESEWRGGDEISRLGRAFASMARALQQRNQYNRAFMSDTLHELRAPVSAMEGAIEILEDEGDHSPEVRTRFTRLLRDENRRLHRLVGELAELTRLDTEDHAHTRQECDLFELLQESATRFEAAREGLPTPTIRLHGPRAPTIISCLPWRMEQVFQNLLENAARHTAPEGLITLTVRVEGDKVVTECRDTGCGIPPENLARVFDRFFTTARKGGTSSHSGLGLAIVRGIIENHGGEITADNHPDGGARFTFSLPLSGG